MNPAAAQAAKRFQSLVRIGYVVGSSLGLVVGGIAALASGFISLIGAAGTASVSLLGVVGTFVSLRIGAFAASFALKGISQAFSAATGANGGMGKSLAEINKQFRELKRNAESAAMSEKRAALELSKARANLQRVQDLPPNNMARREAEQAYYEAELNYKQAKERSADLNEELKKGPEGIPRTDPYAGLTKSQKTFAEALVKLKPKLDELREAVAAGFLPILEEQLNRLAYGPFFDVVKEGLSNVSVALGNAARNLVDFIVKSENIAKLKTVFANAVPTIEGFGTILGKAYDAFLSVLIFADPLVKKFVEFLDRNLTKFSDFLNAPENKAEIEGFFATVSQLATDFGIIFKNVFGGIGDIFAANVGPGSGGQKMVDYLKEITGAFANLETIDGKPIGEFFSVAADNAIAALGLLGDFLKEIFGVADNPNLKIAFDTIKEAAPDFGDVLDKIIDALPSFATLVTDLLSIANSFADTGAITTYFDTLTKFSGAADAIFGNETVQKIMGVTGEVFAFGSAATLGFEQIKEVGDIATGIFGNVSGAIGGFQDGLARARDNMAFLTYSNNGLTGSFGKLGSFLLKSPILIAIGLLIAAFVYLYNTSDSFREFIDTTLSSVLERLSIAFDRIWTAIQPVIDLIINELLPPLMDALQPILEVIVTLFGMLVVVIADTLANAIEIIVPIFMALMEVLKPIIEIFLALIELVAEFAKALITGDWSKFGQIFMDVLHKIVQGLVNLFTGAGNMIIDLINGLIRGFFTGFGGGIADLIKTFSGGTIDLKTNPPQIKRFTTFTVPKFAKGGIVYPSMGGSLVNVAEAGQAERIEPLDENGLSKRDKALILAISGGGSAGATINVYPSAGMNERELANMVSRRLAFEIRKGAF
jgi:phage-related protein